MQQKNAAHLAKSLLQFLDLGRFVGVGDQLESDPDRDAVTQNVKTKNGRTRSAWPEVRQKIPGQAAVLADHHINLRDLMRLVRMYA